VMGLLPDALSASGSIRFGERQVIGARERDLTALRGSGIGVVFQEPLTALDPLMRLGSQLAEPLRRRAGVTDAALDRAGLRAAQLAALDEVRLPDRERILHAYPHEISGGQRQRFALALALAGRPDLLIADEPTTALDVTVQAEILDLLDGLVAERGMSLLFISHDLAVVARVATRVVVLRHGEVVESGTVREVLDAPQHPYTCDLVVSARQLDAALDWSAP